MPLTEQQELLRTTARDFARRELEPRAADVDEAEEFPVDNFRGLAELGLCGLSIDESVGGAGGGYVDLAVVIEEIAAACGSTSTVYITHVSLGIASIARFANEEQAARFVPPLASGEKIAGFALTEPGTGSDALAMETTAVLDGDDYVLNGTKTFITNGTHADTFVVFANTDRSAGYRGINALVVERGMAGFSTNHLTGKMGMKGSATAELVFDNCRVPVANRLDEEGRGYSVALSTLTTSRVSIAAQCVGLARGAYEAALEYAKQRRTFGKAIGEHQAVAFMLADMATEIDAARLMTHRAGAIVDSGGDPVAESAMAKLYASEMLHRVATNAVQIHGGAGYFRPSKVERIYRDAKVTEIYEGTSEIQRLIISRSILGDLG
ncbi:MAG: acyl-CoA dehydrogenase family protein [Chloroflexi bacterium]|nr:acyl-CoA dehydrogenase family protein [Chloroflexota bacterium]